MFQKFKIVNFFKKFPEIYYSHTSLCVYVGGELFVVKKVSSPRKKYKCILLLIQNKIEYFCQFYSLKIF